MEKGISDLKAEFVCMCEREKNNSFKIHVIILKYIKNVDRKSINSLQVVLCFYQK